MKAWRVPVLAIAYVSACAAFHAQGRQPQPKLRLAEVQSVSPVRYRAELSLDPEKTQLVGAIEMALDMKEPPLTL